MSRTDGLTRPTSPTSTVGTVSFPLATDRTTAAASRSSQMLTRRWSMPARSSSRNSPEQNGHPGRQKTVIGGGAAAASVGDVGEDVTEMNNVGTRDEDSWVVLPVFPARCRTIVE